MKNSLSLALFLLLVLGGGLVIGYVMTPGEWYVGLVKPVFTPPAWVFPPAWTLLYILIAIAGWRLWRGLRGSLLMKLWGVQLALNFLWSPTFFGAHLMAAGLAVILALLVTILAIMALAWRRERVVALLFLPYALWVAFASLLNGSLLVLN
ncbi:TspO/MBR family protein [Radicibacter daui]|uniref:TspO/MBR family protein n=1 Tax=Radicibacter daui TaxID=3064829 RepID=UPI004046DFF8